jgi:hypothetical protein
MELRGFFGLCSYYRRFIKGFSQLGAPLTYLTKKGASQWTEEAQQIFEKMKEVMITCPILSLLDFSQSFILECDASGVGIGAVLMQGGHPIVFKRGKLNKSERLYPIYDKEMLAIMHSLTKFRQYLVGNIFVVKTVLRFGYLGKWSPCVYESLNTKGETITLVLYFMILISL